MGLIDGVAEGAELARWQCVYVLLSPENKVGSRGRGRGRMRAGRESQRGRREKGGSGK